MLPVDGGGDCRAKACRVCYWQEGSKCVEEFYGDVLDRAMLHQECRQEPIFTESCYAGWLH